MDLKNRVQCAAAMTEFRKGGERGERFYNVASGMNFAIIYEPAGMPDIFSGWSCNVVIITCRRVYSWGTAHA